MSYKSKRKLNNDLDVMKQNLLDYSGVRRPFRTTLDKSLLLFLVAEAKEEGKYINDIIEKAVIFYRQTKSYDPFV